MSYGLTKEAAELTCGSIAIQDVNWEVKKQVEEEEEPSAFETEVAEEETEVKKRKTTAAGGKAVKREKGKERPVHTEPRAMQMPLFQPWRAFKSEHRLQTKLEKIQTAEQKFLTMEQLLKRAEYALAIKKKDAEPFMVYAIPEEVWDDSGLSIGGKPIGQKTDKSGRPIVKWIKKGGQSIPIVMTNKGPMTSEEADKHGLGAGGAPTSIQEKLIERMAAGKRGKPPIAVGRTKAEAMEEKGREKDKQTRPMAETITHGELSEMLENLTVISDPKRYHKEQELIKKLEKTPIERIDPITKKQLAEQERFEQEVAYMESAPSSQIIGGNVMKEINFDKMRQEDLWAHIKGDLNWTNRAKGDEYEQLYMRIGKNPYTTLEVRNVINQFEAIKRIDNTLILHDFIVHTKNDFLKESALQRLAKEDPRFFEEHIGNPTAPNRPIKNKARYGIKKGDYNKQKKEYNQMKAQKEVYLSQKQGFFEEDRPAKYVEKQFKKPKTDKEAGKAHDPDSSYQVLVELGLAKEGKLTTTPKIKK